MTTSPAPSSPPAKACPRWLAAFALFVATAALAAIYTAADVAEAIRNSPNATEWMRENADAIGNLAMFESGGNTAIYNGSCCSGILQMNNENVGRAGYTRDQYLDLDLQDQVDAWVNVMGDSFNSRNPQALWDMGYFDGRPVTPEMVLACVQLGIGNCGTMISSGSCAGFADSNGTTICDMADAIANGGRLPGGRPGGATGGGSGLDVVTPGGYSGGGFAAGSGQDPARMRLMLQLLLVSIAATVLAGVSLDSWKAYTSGRLRTADLKQKMLLTGVVFAVLLFVGTKL